ncbi:hypothetical protein ACJJTC_003744 [Scirpophaga incertulas]
MTYPPEFASVDIYLEECVQFFKKYQYIFCYQNTDVLVENVLANISVSNLGDLDVFNADFKIEDLRAGDEYFDEFFAKLDKLKVLLDDVDMNEYDYDFDAPLSPKKRYEIVNLAKEVGDLCEASNCDIVVDFGAGMGYLDQILFKLKGYKVLGLDSNRNFLDGALKRQAKYHEDSTTAVKFVKQKITEDSSTTIEQCLQETFPGHGKVCIVGLHACADLTVESMLTFLKMADARSMAVMPCCYHRMSQTGGIFKYFPLSDSLKACFKKHEASKIMGVTFLRLATQAFESHLDLYKMAFDLLSRAVLQVYARKHNFTIHRKKRKAVKLKKYNDFDSYLIEAATNGFKLTPISESRSYSNDDKTTNNFNLDEIRLLWREFSEDMTFMKAAIFILMQSKLQLLVENFVMLDRLVFLRERGVMKCSYKKVYAAEASARCLVLMAVK